MICRAPFRRWTGLLPALALAAGYPSVSYSAETDAENATLQALTKLQQRDETLQSIGWKLVTGNARFCANARPAIGLLLQDTASFSKPEPVRRAIGLTGDIAVQATAAGSPARQAKLPRFAEVLAIDGRRMADLPKAGPGDWRRLRDLHAGVEGSLAAKGSVALTWAAATQAPVTTTIAGIPACPSGFEVIAGSRRASANSLRVAIGEDFVGFTYSEDLFAAAIAHELAHVILGHPAWLDAHGRKRRDIRRTEREADRLMPWLLANAGYDPASGMNFMRLWGPTHDNQLLRDGTHDGWDERADFIAAELPEVRRAMVEGTGADWRRRFRRDVAP